MFKVVTINILYGFEEWEQRLPLLIDGLAAEQADLIALQESKLPVDIRARLSEELGMPYVQLVSPTLLDSKNKNINKSIAIFSRHPFLTQATLDLQSQGRVAQYVQIAPNGQPLVFCNGHYYWHPGPHPERVKQVQRLLDWLAELPPAMPIVAVGDFNATPEMPAIALMRSHFTSAYAVYNSQEPDYTCPTPLARRNWQKVVRYTWRNLKFNRTLRPWRGTLDYIFINHRLRVQNCQLILNKPAFHSRTLYPSDHFGIAADLEILPDPNQRSEVANHWS